MTADRIIELEQRIAQLEKQVDDVWEVVTQSEDVKAVGLVRGAEQAISVLATYLSEVDDGFEPGRVPPAPPDGQGSTSSEGWGQACEGAVPEEAG